MAATKTIPLADIRFDGGTQMRVGLDGDTVQEYRAAYESGADMPAIVVYFDGSSYWLADGFHRWHAKHESGAKDIACEVRKGSQRDAIWHAVGANSSHGLRRTNEDKHMAVKTILADAEWSRLSDRQIADHCGVGNKLVGDIRRQLCSEHSSDKRIGADGKSRKLPERATPAVPQHTKPTPKEADEPKPAAAKQCTPADARLNLSEELELDGDPLGFTCQVCGGTELTTDEDGTFCAKCKDPHEAETIRPAPTKPAKVKSTVIARCEQFWSTLNDTERRVAFGWFQDQLG